MEVLPFSDHSLLGTRNLHLVKSPNGDEPGMLLVMFHFTFRQICSSGLSEYYVPEH